MSLKTMSIKVNNQCKRGIDVYWDGWDIVYFNADPRAEYSSKGVYRNGKFGYENRLSPDRQGKWST